MPLLMADLASLNKTPLITEEHVSELEKEMDSMEAELPPLRAFVIPGDSQSGAFLDLARTITRRAERKFLTLAETEQVHEVDRLFLNRLSDYCFLLMRLEDTSK